LHLLLLSSGLRLMFLRHNDRRYSDDLGNLDLELFGLELEGIVRDNVIDERPLLWLLLETLADDVAEHTIDRHGQRCVLLFKDLLL